MRAAIFWFAKVEKRQKKSLLLGYLSGYLKSLDYPGLSEQIMKFPSEVYHPSPRRYEGIKELEYPMHDKIIQVTSCGRICYDNKKINLSHVFAGQKVGLKETDDGIGLVSFMDYD